MKSHSLNRRHFLSQAIVFSGGLWLWGCGRDTSPLGARDSNLRGTVTLYDTHAMALYFDGGLGPKTGIIKVDYILQNSPVTLEFRHGHGGKSHFFTLLPEHYAELRQLRRVSMQTTSVADHSHKLFIDPVDPRYRVAGAQPIPVPTEPA